LRGAVKEDDMEGDDEPVVEVESLARKGAVDRFGKYRSLGRIGQGGMADVFLAVGRGPAGFNKLVVIKRLRDQVASDDAFRDMFLDEARLAARLNHPNVVQTYEVFEHEGAFFITMEYLEGQPLSKVARECAKRGMRLQPAISARIISDALCGLHYAHEARDFDGEPLQIVHRDVSPQNIFVTYDGQVKVVDFGIAKAERSSTKTQAGFFKGKAAYMAPEQLEGGAIDRRVDVFTTGIVLWELLAGRRLMAAESTAKTLVRLLRDPVPRVSEIASDIEPALDGIVARALQRDPAARYQTAGEMREALEQYLVQSGHSVRHEEIGRMVGEVFRDTRANLQRAIREQMARVSEFPRSGTMPVASIVPGLASLPQGLEMQQPASMTSMSGINVSRTLSSVYASPAGGTGVAVAEPFRKGGLRTTLVVAAAVAVSIAVGFTLIHRTLMAPPTGPSAPAAVAPTTMRAAPTAAPGAIEALSPEPLRVDPAPSPYLNAPPAAARPAQAPPVWRPPPRPQATEAKAAGAAPRSSPPSGAGSPTAGQTNAPPGGPSESEPSRPTVAAPPPPSAPPPAAPTQEGRKFRISL
jgi:serine/threonine-protein kinase